MLAHHRVWLVDVVGVIARGADRGSFRVPRWCWIPWRYDHRWWFPRDLLAMVSGVCHPPQWCVHAPVILEELVLPFAWKWRIYRIKKLWCPSSWRAKCRCVSTKIRGSTRPRVIGFMGACYNSSLHGDLKSMVKYQRGFRQVEAAQMLTILRHVGDVFLWEAHEDG
jgi:hypothetical protein